MKLVRINESSDSLNELFGRKKSNKKSTNAKSATKVERNVFNNNDIKKWLKQAKFTGKDLEAGFQSVNDTAKITLTTDSKTIGVALYRNKVGNNAMVATTLGSGDTIGSLWVKHDLFSGEGSWSKIMTEFTKCEYLSDFEGLLKKYKFSEQKTY